MNPANFRKFALELPPQDAGVSKAAVGELPSKYTNREEYLRYLSQFPVKGGGGFRDVPSLGYANIGEYPAIRGHEGRHRMLALQGLGEESSLVRLQPHPYLKQDLKDKIQENFPYRNPYEDERLITRFKSHVYENPKVIPEGRTLDDFNLIDLPEPYAAGGEIREAHSNGKRVVGPLAAAAESAMTRAAEKILADKAAERAARYVADPEQRAANLAKWQAQTQAEIAEPTWYHGTFTDVDSLRPGRADATFVSRDPNFANRFATPADKGPSADWDAVNKVWVSRESLPSAPNVMPLHVRAENPFDYENPAHVEAVLENLSKTRPLFGKWDKIRLSGGNWDDIESSYYQKAIRDLGHDSFYVMEDGAKNLGLYDPTRQLKSATGNLGTFDPNIPRLTEAKGGTVVKRAIMLASKMA